MEFASNKQRIIERPHVVFIVPAFDHPAPRTIRVRQLVKHLKKDFNITVLCLKAGLTQVEKTNSDDYFVVRVPYSGLSRFITLRRYSDITISHFVSRIVRPISYLLRRFVFIPDPWIVESNRLIAALNELETPVDVVVAVMMPFSVGMVAADFKQGVANTKKVPLVCDIGDPLAHNIIQSMRHSKKRLMRYERTVLEHSDHIIVTNEATAAHYGQEYHIAKELVSCIPQGAQANPPLASSQPNNSSGLIKMVYAGIFIQSIRNPSLLFNALKAYQDSIALTVYGSIDQCFVDGNEHIAFKGEVPHAEVLDRYPDANCVLYIDNSEGMQTSGKIYELLALRMPVLFIYTNHESPVKRLCEAYQHVILCESSATAISSVLNSLDARIKRANEWLESSEGDYHPEKFSWESRASQYKDVLISMCKR